MEVQCIIRMASAWGGDTPCFRDTTLILLMGFSSSAGRVAYDWSEMKSMVVFTGWYFRLLSMDRAHVASIYELAKGLVSLSSM
jgi:hypothetical protein